MNLYLEALDRIHEKKDREKAPPPPKPEPKKDENFGDAGYFFPKK